MVLDCEQSLQQSPVSLCLKFQVKTHLIGVREDRNGPTFMFVVGELPVGHSEPSLFKISFAKTFSPLGTFLNLPIRNVHKIEV